MPPLRSWLCSRPTSLALFLALVWAAPPIQAQEEVNSDGGLYVQSLVARARESVQRQEPRLARETYLASLSLGGWRPELAAEYAEFEYEEAAVAARARRWREAQVRLASALQETTKALEAFRATGEGGDEPLRQVLRIQDTVADEVLFVDEKWRREIATTVKDYLGQAQKLYDESKGIWDDQAKQREVLWTLQRAGDYVTACPEDLRRQWEELASKTKSELGEKPFQDELLKIKIARGSTDIRFIDGAQLVAAKEPGRYESYIDLRDRWNQLRSAHAQPDTFHLEAYLSDLDGFVTRYPRTEQGQAVAQLASWLRQDRRFTVRIKEIGRRTSIPRMPKESISVQIIYNGREGLRAAFADLGANESRQPTEGHEANFVATPFAQLELKVLRSHGGQEECVLYKNASGFMIPQGLGGTHSNTPSRLATIYRVIIEVEPPNAGELLELP